MLTRLNGQYLGALMASVLAVQIAVAPAWAQSNSWQFFDSVNRSVDNATTVRIFRLQKALLADTPTLTVRDIPATLSERSFDKADKRLRVILEMLSKKNSYDFENLLSTQTRAQFGIMFSGPSGRSALLFPLPMANQSTAVTTRFVTEQPIDVGASSAVFLDAATLARDVARLLEGGLNDQ